MERATCHPADETCFYCMKIYVNSPKTLGDFKFNITLVIADIYLCENVIENFAQKVAVCKKSRAGHLADIIFHS